MTRDARPLRDGAPLLSRRVAVSDGPPGRRLRFTVDNSAGEPPQVHVAGELDVATAPLLAAELRALGEDSDEVRVDLSGITFIDLAGLRVLLDARVRIVAAGGACGRLLEVTRTTHLLEAD